MIDTSGKAGTARTDEAPVERAPFPPIAGGDIVTIRAAGGAFSGRDYRALKCDVLLDVISVREDLGPGDPRLELYGYEMTPTGAYRRDGEMGDRLRTVIVAPGAVAEVRPALRVHDRARVEATGELVVVLRRFADEETGTRMCTVTGSDPSVRTVREYALRLAELDPGEVPHSAPGVLPDVRTGDLLSLAGTGAYNAHWFPVRTSFGLRVTWAGPVTNEWGTFVHVSGFVLDTSGAPVGGSLERMHTDVYVTADGLAEHRRPLEQYEEVTDLHGTRLLVWAVGLGSDSGARMCSVIDVERVRYAEPLRLPEWTLRRVGGERERSWSPPIAPGQEVRVRCGWDADGPCVPGDALPPFALRVRHVAPHARHGREWLHLAGEVVDPGDGTPLDGLRERVARGVLVLPHAIER